MQFKRSGPLFIPDYQREWIIPSKTKPPDHRFQRYKERYRPKQAWAHVQSNGNETSSGTSANIAYGSNVTAGNLLVFFSWGYNDVTATVADSLGQTWPLAKRQLGTLNLGGNAASMFCFYFENTTGGANTVTITYSGTILNPRVAVMEYSGIATSSSLDVTAGDSQTNNSPSAGSLLTSFGGELILGFCVNTVLSALTVGSGYTDRLRPTVYDSIEEKNASTSGSYIVDWSKADSQDWVAVGVAFKQPGGAARARWQF